MTVLNKHKLPGKQIPEGAVYIGRPSKWGNPFEIGKDGNRDEVCDRYADFLDFQIHTFGLPMVQQLAELHGKDLVCFCAPARCHGHYLEKKALWAFELLQRKEPQ